MDQTSSFKDRFVAARSMLEAIGQGHVLSFYNTLDSVSKDKLLDQIESVDWEEVSRLIQTHVLTEPKVKISQNIEPAPYYPCEPDESLVKKYQKAKEHGEKLIRDGRIAAFIVAGGQGTRLGWPGPKGTFACTPIREKTLFDCFAEYIRNMQNKYECEIPLYIMTSPLNHKETVTYFQTHSHLGLDPANVMCFPQQLIPSIDKETGKVLMSAVDSIALSPNGHGGSLKALYTSGALHDMRERGIKHMSYIQVDNPLVKVVDPLFIGLHAIDNAEMSSKMLEKRDPFERVGNFCKVDGKVSVIEYSDMPDELAVQKTGDGELKFRCGSIAIHMLTVDFIERINKGHFHLPFHRAVKKVPYINIESMMPFSPDEPNGVKFETFVFDALPLCEHSITFETIREEEFAPIKNATGPGVLDTVETSKLMQSDRAGAWLEVNGVEVPRDTNGHIDAVIEISQLTAACSEDLEDYPLPEKVEKGARILL